MNIISLSRGRSLYKNFRPQNIYYPLCHHHNLHFLSNPFTGTTSRNKSICQDKESSLTDGQRLRSHLKGQGSGSGLGSIIPGSFMRINKKLFSTDANYDSINNNQTKSNNNNDKPDDSMKPLPTEVIIYFGSQSGQALSLSHDLRKTINRDYKNILKAKVVDLADFDPNFFLDHKNQKIFAFVTACFGEGQPTDNAKSFYEWLMHKDRLNEKQNFSKIEYIIFGLGQSTHFPTRYQAVSKEIEFRLNELGARRLFKRGEGDDAGDMESDWQTWRDKVLPFINNFLTDKPISSSVPPVQNLILNTTSINPSSNSKENISLGSSSTAFDSHTNSPPIQVHSPNPIASSSNNNNKSTNDNSSACKPQVSSSPILYTIRNPYFARVLTTYELHSMYSKQSCTHVTFDLTGGLYTNCDDTSNSNTFTLSDRVDGTNMNNDNALKNFNCPVPYTSGDYLGVWPKNNHGIVKSLAKRLDLSLGTMINISEYPQIYSNRVIVQAGEYDHNHKQYITGPGPHNSNIINNKKEDIYVSLATILSRYADLSVPCPRSTLSSLAKYASNIMEQNALLLLSDIKNNIGLFDYNSFILEGQRNLLDVLEAFPSINQKIIPLNELLDLLPVMQTRYYSISSSPWQYHVNNGLVDHNDNTKGIANPRAVDITCGLFTYVPGWSRDNIYIPNNKTSNNMTRNGLCSGFLYERQINDVVPLFVKQSLFKLIGNISDPDNEEKIKKNIICFAAGTGVAPFRAFIQERSILKSMGREVGKIYLFYGCAHKEMDFLYKNEILQAEAKGIVKVINAFSHMQGYRIFIQHRILENESLLFNLIVKENSYIYVCGSLKRIAPAVFDSLTIVLMKNLKISNEEAKNYLKNLQADHRYQQDCF